MTFLGSDKQPGGVTPGDADPCCFVFDTAGVAGGNLYTSWATLAAAILLVEGVKSVWVRTSATIPAGAYPMPEVWFDGPTTVTLDTVDGVALRGVLGVRGITCTSSNTGATAMFEVGGGTHFVVTDHAQIVSKDATAQALIGILGPGAAVELSDGGALIGNEDDPVLEVIDGANVLLEVNAGSYSANSLQTTGTGTIKVLNAGSNADRNQPLALVGLDLLYGNPNDNAFLATAGGVLPSASFEAATAAWAHASGNVSLPDATRSAGPHYVLPDGVAVTVSLANPAQTLDGVVGGTFVVLVGQCATFKSDGVGAWITFCGDPALIFAQATDDSVLALSDAAFTDIAGLTVAAFRAGVYMVNAGANCNTDDNETFDLRLIAGATPVNDSLRTIGGVHGAGGPALDIAFAVSSLTPSVAAGTLIRLQQQQNVGAGTLGVQHRNIHIVRIGP